MNSSLPSSLKVSLASALAAGLFAFAASAEAQILQNGGFENNANSLSSPTNLTNGSTLIPNWTVLTAGSAQVGFYSTGAFGIASQAGSYYLDLTGTGDGTSGDTDTHGDNTFGGVDQTFGTTVGDSYLVQFYIGNSSSYTGSLAGIDGYITTSAPASYASLVGTATNFSQDLPTSTTTTNWTAESFSFTATSTSTTLSLVGFEPGTGLQYIGLDSVSVTDQTSHGVPDSGSTLLLVVLGLGLLAVRKASERKIA